MSASSKSDVILSVILTRPLIFTSVLIISYIMIVITNVVNVINASSKNVFMFDEVIVQDNHMHNTCMCIREMLLIRLG